MIILGIDPGRRSGWAVAVDHETIMAHGHAICADDRAAAVQRAHGLAAHYETSLAVAMETPSGHGNNRMQAAGMGRSRGQWFECLEREIGIKMDHVRMVTADKWRRATHGTTTVEGSTKDEKSKRLKGYAQAYTGIRDPDAAEAACIAMWGAMEVS